MENAQIRGYLHLDPDKLTDDEFVHRTAEAIFIRDQSKELMKEAMLEVFEIAGLVKREE